MTEIQDSVCFSAILSGLDSVKKFSAFPLLLAMLGVPGAAFASDYTGFFAVMYLLLVVATASALNLGMIIAFYFTGKYSNAGFAKRHALLFSVVPVIGCLLSLIDFRTSDDLVFTLGFNLLALSVGLLPLLLNRVAHKVEKIEPTTQLGVALVCLLLSLLTGPIVITAIIVAHTTLGKTSGNWRIGNLTLLGACYLSLASWVIPLWGTIFPLSLSA